MLNTKQLRNYLKLLRIKRTFFSFRKTMGINLDTFKEEETILADFLSSFSFTESDQNISQKLTIKNNEDDKYKKFIYENTDEDFLYFVQGDTKNTSIHIKVENKKIKHWRFFAQLFSNTPFQFLFFDIRLFLTDKRSEQSFILFKMEVSSTLNLMKIYSNQEYGSSIQIEKAREVVKQDLEEARVAVDTFKSEINIDNKEQIINL